jgi:hypothetical protein
MPNDLPEAEYPALVELAMSVYLDNPGARGLTLRKLPIRYRAAMQTNPACSVQAQLDLTFLRKNRNPPGGGDALVLWLEGLRDQLVDEVDLSSVAYVLSLLQDPDTAPIDQVGAATAALPGAGLLHGKLPQLERVLHNTPNFRPIRFLQLGLERARAVVKIIGPSGDLGTGFLMEPGWLVTNHHVWPDEATVRGSTLLFGYEEDLSGAIQPGERVPVPATGELRMSPMTADDLTVLRVSPGLLRRGALPPPTPIDAPVGATVPIIQHPLGTPKKIVLTEATLTSVLPGQRLRYTSDTDRGSSGSPVFDLAWNLVGVHHASLPAPEEAGRPMRNEGIHVGRLLALIG